jgi:hypothetical protein
MAKWLDKYEQGGLVLKQKTKDNYGKKPNPNNVQASVGPDFVGMGNNTKGRNYSPAWGGQFQNGGKKKKKDIQDKVEDWLGNPMQKAEITADKYTKPGEDQVDNIRHPMAGRYVSEAIQNKLYNIPGISQIAGFLGASAAGLGHELVDPNRGAVTRPYSLYDTFKEGAEDQFNNMIGAAIGSTPFISKDQKDKIIKYLSDKNMLPDGYRDKDNMYRKHDMGGSIPGAVGFTYARTAGAAPSNGKYAKKTKASAQDGKVLDPNADDRATLDFNNPDPAFQYVRANSFVPFDTKNFEGIKQNIAGYMKSPLYSKRLSLSIPDQELAKDVQQQRLDNLLSIKLNPNTVDRGTDYNMITNRVNLGASDFVDNPSIAHEVAHGIIPNRTLSYGKQNLLSRAANVVGDLFQPFEQFSKSELEKINIPLSGRVTAPNEAYQKAIQEEHYKPQGSRASAKTAANETYGDLTGMRQLLLDNGITTEFGQELTPEMFQKALKNPKINNQPGMQRMRLKFKDEDIIKMNNEVAQLNNTAPLTQAQNGKEMRFYQQGLDFTPKNISKNGSVIKDDMGQWAHPGEITEINSNDITMEGVDYPVLGVSDTGDTKMMYPDQDYKFDGEKVTEFPMMKNGGWLDNYTPKAQTGIEIGVGSGTYQPTSKVVTQEEIKKQKDKEKQEAFQAAANREKANRSYVSKDKSTPASRAADQQMLTDAYMAEAQRNSPLAQTFGSLTPSGYNPGAGAVAANQFVKTTPLILAGGVGATAMPSIVAGLNAPMAGVAGLTGSNLLSAGFAYEGLNRIPGVAEDWKTAVNDPSFGSIGNALLNTGLTTLDVLPFASEVTKGAKYLKKLNNAANISKETPVINDMGEIINAAPIEESASKHLYNPVTGQTLQYDASGNIISSSKKLTKAEIIKHNREMRGIQHPGYTPPPPEGMEPYLSIDDTPKPSWQQQELPGLHLSSTMEGGPISKIVEPKTGLVNVEQALGIIGKESGGASKVDLIKKALGDELPKKMDYNDFRKTVQDQLIPLERNFTMQRSNFGIDNLGFNKKVGMLGNTTREAAGAEIERIKEIIRTEEGVLGEEERVEQLKKILDRDIKDYNNLPLENQTLLLSNKEKFGRGSDAHSNPEETLGHIHFLRDADTPDILTVTQIQSDAFQGTHRVMPSSLENAEFSLNRLESIVNERNKLLESLKAEKKLARDEASNTLATKENLHKLDEQINRYAKLIEEQQAINKLSKAEVENYTQKSLLDKKHQDRFLQELVDYAGKRGDVSKIRVPTSETAAKVQNYKNVDSEEFVSMYREALAKDPAAFAEKINNLPESERKFIQSILDGKIKGSVFDPEAQTILKKYTEQPKLIKKLFGKEPKIVTDGKGNSWYEFDIPNNFKGGKGEIKAFKSGGWLNKYK